MAARAADGRGRSDALNLRAEYGIPAFGVASTCIVFGVVVMGTWAMIAIRHERSSTSGVAFQNDSQTSRGNAVMLKRERPAGYHIFI